MGLGSKLERADRLEAYIGEVTRVMGNAAGGGPLSDYCAVFLPTDGRRSVEPMAAVTCPGHVSAQHQSLLHFVGNSLWSNERVLGKVQELVVPSITGGE